MDGNKNTNESSSTAWYKIPLRDLSIIAGALLFIYVNTTGSSEAIKAELSNLSLGVSDIKTSIKEIQAENKQNAKEYDRRFNELEVRVHLLEDNLKSLQNKK